MVGPRCEHLAHLLAWGIQNRMSVRDMLAMPFYHPVLEEALQDALHQLDKRLKASRSARSRSGLARAKPRVQGATDQHPTPSIRPDARPFSAASA